MTAAMNLEKTPSPAMAGRADLWLGARIRVSNDCIGDSYHEGVIMAVEPMLGANGSGECLRVAVEKSVMPNRSQDEPIFPVMLVDTSISMERVKLKLRKGCV